MSRTYKDDCHFYEFGRQLVTYVLEEVRGVIAVSNLHIEKTSLEFAKEVFSVH
jgi:hypothetical protein